MTETIAEAIMRDGAETLKRSIPNLVVVFSEAPNEDAEYLIKQGVPAGYFWEAGDIPAPDHWKTANNKARVLPCSVVVVFPYKSDSRTENLRATGRRLLAMIQKGFAEDVGRGSWPGAAAVPNASDTIEQEGRISDLPVPDHGFVQVDFDIVYHRSFNDPAGKT